jgi:ABC-type transport system involved in Fe-S cluster assembly fused permease/ATPase subunit
MQNLKVYNFLEKLFGMVGNIRIHPVDFNLPWYYIYKRYWLRLGISAITEVMLWTVFATLPLSIASIITDQNQLGGLVLGIIFLCIPIIAQVHIRSYCLALSGLMRSVATSAYEFFVKVDPIHHSTRESGKIIAKINRAVNAYEDITDTLVYNILPFCIQIGVVLFSFSRYNLRIGLFAGLSLIILVIVSIVSQIIVAKNIIPVDNDQGDIQSQVEVESLQQVALIRSSFATPEHIEKIKKTNIRTGEVDATIWTSFTATSFIPRILFAITFIILISSVLNLVKLGSLDLVTAIALMTIYVSSYGNIVHSGRHIERIISNIERLKNLYTYIREYGDSSYPV